MTALARVEGQVFADYHQFYVVDGGSWDSRSLDTDTSNPEFWSHEAFGRGLAVLPAALGIGTASYGPVPVVVEVGDARPSLVVGDFDRVVEASLNLAFGTLMVIDSTAPDGLRAKGPPAGIGWLCARRGSTSVFECGDGGDRYALWMWREPPTPTAAVKTYTY